MILSNVYNIVFMARAPPIIPAIASEKLPTEKFQPSYLTYRQFAL